MYPLVVLIQALSILAAGASGDPKTPNELLQSGVPTFVVGTRGDDRADRLIRTQAEFIRDLIFPGALILDDTELHEDPAEWPERLVVYGGAHVWVSGQYGGRALGDWRDHLPAELPPLEALLDRRFFSFPEQVTYPCAGLYVGACVEEFRLENTRDWLFGVNARKLATTCEALNTTPELMQRIYADALSD